MVVRCGVRHVSAAFLRGSMLPQSKAKAARSHSKNGLLKASTEEDAAGGLDSVDMLVAQLAAEQEEEEGEDLTTDET